MFPLSGVTCGTNTDCFSCPCFITDPNVEVIYVSPVPINDECMQYYSKLLALKPAVDSGHVENQTDLSDRFKIVIPEAIKSFPVRISH